MNTIIFFIPCFKNTILSNYICIFFYVIKMTSLPNDMIREIMFHTTSLNDLQRLSQINQYANALYHNYFSWVEKRRKEFLFNDVLPTDLNDIKILYQKLDANYQLA